MSRLSELAVAKRSVTLLLAAALFIAGISAWGRLQQELLPDIDFPVITVVAPLPGASATDVASQVAEPIDGQATLVLLHQPDHRRAGRQQGHYDDQHERSKQPEVQTAPGSDQV